MTVGDRYQVSWEEQIAAAGYVGNAMGTCEAEIGQMRTETNTMLEAWKDSPTKTEYSGRQGLWLKSADDILKILAEFRTSLETSADISRDTELANSKTMAD